MKSTASFRLAAMAAALALGMTVGVASATLTDIAATPLASSASNLVKPNVSYVLDTSGSMAWSHAPDEARPWYNNVGYKTSQCNSIYYNPKILYPPPRLYDGTTMPNSSFTAAPINGFNSFDGTSSSTVDLSRNFYAYDNTSSNGAGTDPNNSGSNNDSSTNDGKAYYYLYSGSQDATGLNYQNTNSTFYKECNASEAPFTASTLTFSGSSLTAVTSVTVNGTNIMNSATTASTDPVALANAVAAKITVGGYSATASGGVVTINGIVSAGSATPVVVANPPIPAATITFSGNQTTSVTGITVNGVQIMGGASTASNVAATEAANVASQINQNGFTASVSGAVVTINGPTSASGFTPAVTKVGTQGTTISFAGSLSTTVSAIKVNGFNIMSSAAAATTNPNTLATSVAGKITVGGYSASASGSTVTITGPATAAGFSPVITSSFTGSPQGTIVFSTNSNSTYTNVKVNGTSITSGNMTASTSTNMATTVAANINAAGVPGYSALASFSTVTITGPATAAGGTITANKSSGSMNAAFTNFTDDISGTGPAFTSNGTMTTGTTQFPPPGIMTVAIQPFGPFAKVIVSATSGPTGNDERQNFANWFTYYRLRIAMMKSGLGRAFVGIGSTYRVGFMTIYATPSNSTTDPGYLAIGDFTTTPGGQKQKWFNKVYSQTPGGSTPLKTALSTASRNIAGKVGPDPVQYSCQQNFVLLSTDGYWNDGTPNGVKLNGSTSVGNQDSDPVATPPPMYDGGLAGASNTLADVAAYYYNTDLRPSTGTCNTGVSGADVCLDNVPTDPLDSAPWQHVTLFTLGLGTNGQLILVPEDLNAVPPIKGYLGGGSPDYNAIKGGSRNWPVPVGDTLTTIDDLWHAAVNGHGQYFSAKNPDLLVTGLQTALNGVSARVAAGAAAATSNLEPVAGDNFAFVASYTTQEWTGEIQSRSIDLTSGVISTTANWSAQGKLDLAVSATTDSRTIFTFLSGSKVDFKPASFSATQKSNWFTPGNAPVLSQYSGWNAAQIANGTADTVINYLRGQTGFQENAAAGVNQLYRVRTHTLGDIIDGKPVYVRLPPFNYSDNGYAAFKTSGAVTSRPGTVYVGANDGMLHAFDSATGNEIWAYVPSFVLPNLKALAGDDYPNAHRYYVDGSPVVGDVYTGTAWKTILVGGLNAGGKGYYALDITDPTTPLVLWEFSDTNLGFSFGNPVIGKLSDGTWSVMFSSGYNNVGNGIGQLYVLNAYTGVVNFTVSTGVGSALTPSGLGKIAAWVDNGLLDNTIQRVYGGDTFGNLWRFDVNNIIPPAGIEATQLAFFQTTGPTYNQPITTQPELGLVSNKPVIYVGTGKYLGATDLTDLGQQSLYAIVDNLTATGLGNARTETTCPLVQQSLTVIDVNHRSTSTLPVNLASKCGWFLDFNPTGGNTPGERVNVDPKLQLGVLAVATNIPDQSVCTVGGTSFLYFFDYTTGQFVSTSTGAVAGQRIGNAIAVGINTYQLPGGKVVSTVTTSDDQHPVFGNPSNPLAAPLGRRVGWRELLN